MTEIKLLDDWQTQSATQQSPETWTVPLKRGSEPENWYAEPFTKRQGCGTPGQCGGDCDCGCPYNTMSEAERLPLIHEIAQLFPNEWLAFIISSEEDDEFEPQHGKLVAHSPSPDELYDATTTVLWNQHIYTFFNGSYEAMQASYGDSWSQPAAPPPKRVASGPKQVYDLAVALEAEAESETPPDNLVDLIYSAVDQLYGVPKLDEAIRRLRLARVRANQQANPSLTATIDQALDMLESSLPRIDEVIWLIEESVVEL